MSIHFHKLKVKQVKKETPDCVSVSFDVPENLREAFLYKEGQSITIKKVINGEELRRSYSICNAPHENELRVAIRKIGGGAFSGFANNHLKAGDELEVMSPSGRFTSKFTEGSGGNYLAIAAGSGITPVIAIIKHTLAMQEHSRFTLIYGNRTRGSIIFFEELEGLKNKYMDRFNLVNILSRERTDSAINYGRLSLEKLEALSSLVNYTTMDAAYICGPEEMIFTAKDFLQSKGIADKKIHFELFTTPGQKVAVADVKKSATEGEGPVSRMTVKLDGRSFDFDLGANGKSILDGALEQGADLPFACKGGVCATCKAKVIEGEVKMDINYALEEDEVKAGFILTCQSHPVSEKVVVDFDIK